MPAINLAAPHDNVAFASYSCPRPPPRHATVAKTRDPSA